MYLWVAKSLDTGDGVPKNQAEAMAWYRIAADEGSTEAKRHLNGEAALAKRAS
jgi:TPR repeat protein